MLQLVIIIVATNETDHKYLPWLTYWVNAGNGYMEILAITS